MEKWLLKIEKILMVVAMAAVFVMMCMTTVDALCRYLLDSPITGAYEITEKYLMLIAVFLGMSFTYRGSGLIRVTILMDRLPDAVKIPINHLSQLFSIVYCAILVVGTFQYATRLYEHGTTLGSLYFLPQWIGGAFIPIGLFLMGLFLLTDFPKVRKGTSALFHGDEPTT